MTRPISKKPNLDHWGFYQVGTFKTYSKIEAIEVSGVIKQPVKFNFNDEVFGAFDWTKEPPGDLKHWYKARAEQLRNEYDYIALLYSGGADSHNILQTFLENNIFIEELVQYVVTDGVNNGKHEEANKEVFTLSAPKTQEFIKNNPLYHTTKHRIVDGAKYYLDSWSNQNIFDSWYMMNNWNFSPYSRVMGGIKHIVPEYKKLVEQGKKVCLLWGWDKLSMVIDQDLDCKVQFLDSGTASTMHPQDRWKNDQNLPIDECFYWSPDLPELICKQAHQVKSFFSRALQHPPDGINIRHSDTKKEFIPNKVRTLGNIPPIKFSFNNENLELSLETFHKIIYPHYKPDLVWEGGKPVSSFFGGRDDWLWNTNIPELKNLVHLYGQGVVWLRKTVKAVDPSLWWEKPYNPSVDSRYCAGLTHFRNYYSIGKIQIAQ